MKPGYLRRNGVPYSANTVMTEYFDRFDVPGGDTLLVVCDGSRRPHLPGHAVLDEHPFQETERRLGLESHAVFGALMTGASGMTTRIGTLVTLGLVLAIVRIGGQAPPPAAAGAVTGVRPVGLLDSRHARRRARTRGRARACRLRRISDQRCGAAVRAVVQRLPVDLAAPSV